MSSLYKWYTDEYHICGWDISVVRHFTCPTNMSNCRTTVMSDNWESHKSDTPVVRHPTCPTKVILGCWVQLSDIPVVRHLSCPTRWPCDNIKSSENIHIHGDAIVKFKRGYYIKLIASLYFISIYNSTILKNLTINFHE